MDEIDVAQRENERHLTRALSKINTQREISATGKCLNCHEPQADNNRRWCDADCRTDWEKRQRTTVKR